MVEGLGISNVTQHGGSKRKGLTSFNVVRDEQGTGLSGWIYSTRMFRGGPASWKLRHHQALAAAPRSLFSSPTCIYAVGATIINLVERIADLMTSVFSAHVVPARGLHGSGRVPSIPCHACTRGVIGSDKC